MKMGWSRLHTKEIEECLWFGGLVPAGGLSWIITLITSNFRLTWIWDFSCWVSFSNWSFWCSCNAERQRWWCCLTNRGQCSNWSSVPKRTLEDEENVPSNAKLMCYSQWTQTTPLPFWGLELWEHLWEVTPLAPHCLSFIRHCFPSSQPDLHFLYVTNRPVTALPCVGTAADHLVSL